MRKFSSKPGFLALAFTVTNLFWVPGLSGQQTTTFTSSGGFTWTAPPGVTAVTVEAWGGGGRGAAMTSAGEGGGGGGGAYSRKVVPVTPGLIYSGNVGAGTNNASPGGDSWFYTTSTILAKGGNSAAVNSPLGATGGAAAAGIGDEKYSGGNGATADHALNRTGGGGSSAGTTANGTNGVGALGGLAPAGGGNGGNGGAGDNTNGTLGGFPGGGGGGGDRQSSGGSGGNGRAGMVVITWCPTYTLSSVSTSATPICSGTAKTLTLTSPTLHTGGGVPYNVTYNLGGANNGTGYTATMTIAGAAGSGTITIPGSVLPNSGLTTVTITGISFRECSRAITANNTTAFNSTASPSSPVVSSPVVYCKDAGAATLTAVGTNLLWYQTESAGVGTTTAPLPSTATIGTTSYYVTQTLGGCESPRAKIDVLVGEGATWFLDADNDGYYTGAGIIACSSPGTGYKSAGLLGGMDCNDADPAIHASYAFFVDADGDGVGSGLLIPDVCAVDANTPPPGYSASGTDCAPHDANRWQSARLYPDGDNDGYTVGGGEVRCYGATLPVGWTLTRSETDDCNDSDPAVHAGGYAFFLDADGDGAGAGTAVQLCTGPGTTPPPGYALTGTDCDDNDAKAFPGQTWYIDEDNDGFPGASTTACLRPVNGKLLAELSGTATDCADNDPAVNPGVTPVITAPADIMGAKTSDDGNGDCETVVELGSATYTSDCGGPYTLAPFIGTTPVSAFTRFGIGTTVVTWRLLNSAGQVIAAKEQNVMVTDDESPVLTPAPDQDVYMRPENSSCSIVVPDLRGTATDNCGSTMITQSLPAGTIVPASHNTPVMITVTATDAAGLADVKTVQLRPKDGTPPGITAPPDLTVPATGEGLCTKAGISLGTPATTDNCSDVTVKAYVNGFVINPASYPFPVGTTLVTWEAEDAAGNRQTAVQQVRVQKVQTTTTLSVIPVDPKPVQDGPFPVQHFSEKVSFIARVSPACPGAGAIVHDATYVTFKIGAQTMGVAKVDPAGQAVLPGIVLTETVQGELAAGIKTVNAIYSGYGNYLGSTGTAYLEIRKEELCATYNGQLSVAAVSAGKNASKATFTLSVGLSDLDGVGDITKLQVKFTVPGTPAPYIVNVQPLNNAKTEGNAAQLIDLPFNGTFTTIDVNYEILGDYYEMTKAGSCDQDGKVPVTLYLPQNDFITGGGWVKMENPVGILPADKNRKANFGFNVKFTKSGTNLQGNINYIFRRKEDDGIVHVYQVKGNAMTSLSVDANGGTAVFNGKCNVADITENPDPVIPLKDYLGSTGNSTMQVMVKDGDGSGGPDEYAITVWNAKNELFHSSNWVATKTVKQVIGGGNIRVTSGTVASKAGVHQYTTRTSSPDLQMEITEGLFHLKAYPNPANAVFQVVLESANKKDKIMVNVFDAHGRTVERRANLSAGGVITLGSTYAPGIYIIQMIQGTKTKQIKVMKYN